MKNNFIKIFFLLFVIIANSNAEELQISSAEIQYNKNLSIWELNKDIVIIDSKKNKLLAQEAFYDKNKQIITTKGPTEIFTNEGYYLNGRNVIFNNNNKTITSDYPSEIKDSDGNTIKLDIFNYQTVKKFFYSKGSIEILDINENVYQLTEVFIDANQNKIVGTDIKAFLNQKSLKVNESNEPRFFSNTVVINDGKSHFNKGVFTYCKDEGEEKCPVWSLLADKITHDTAKKTIYYDNATLKIFDFPIFYFPKFAHPDPTVKRRSGFLNPTFSNNSNLGSGFTMPYFWAISDNKDFTISPVLYSKTDPLLLAEYRHEFKKSSLRMDFGFVNSNYDQSKTGSTGARSHLFSTFDSLLIDEDEKYSDFKIQIQQVTNEKYLKAFDVDTSLASKNVDILENHLKFKFIKDEILFDSDVSIFEDLGVQKNSDKYEYNASANVNKYFFNQYGNFNLLSSFENQKFETNKSKEVVINKVDWKSKYLSKKFGFRSNFLATVVNSNYNALHVEELKNNKTQNEFSSSLGFYSESPLMKSYSNKNTTDLLTPKFLLRYSPTHMRNNNSGRLTYLNVFDLNKVDDLGMVESGLSATIGLDYKKYYSSEKNSLDKEKISLTLGQVINETENNEMPSSMSLNQRFSDIVGQAKFSINDISDINYKFSLDQGMGEMHYNEVDATLMLNDLEFKIGYLQEKNHIGNDEYVVSSLNYNLNDANKFSISTKRNILNNSTDYYNLAYEYEFDCLKAGIVYRREFYEDNDIEADDTLMFKISLIPFADLITPTLQNKR